MTEYQFGVSNPALKEEEEEEVHERRSYVFKNAERTTCFQPEMQSFM